MRKFRKLVAIEPIKMIPEAIDSLGRYADEVIIHSDMPQTADETAARIGDADAALVSFTTAITAEILAKCPCLKYVGMCCSLYSPESANVDIHYADGHGITVTGIRDYGDEGVIEYVVSELARCLHGFGQPAWFGAPSEITGLKAGVVGLGKSGGMIADAMKFFGAEVGYFARSQKPAAEAKGYRFMPLDELVGWSDVIFCCLNRNTVLLHEKQFELMGDHKILFNTGLSPAWDEPAFKKWLDRDNICFCDTTGAAGSERMQSHRHMHCMGVSSGLTKQSYERLSQKVLANIENYLKD
jgi:lactate dehydrogenase-like 2-hydroxyacid dehydrogenase